jgi:hypothetical protein
MPPTHKDLTEPLRIVGDFLRAYYRHEPDALRARIAAMDDLLARDDDGRREALAFRAVLRRRLRPGTLTALMEECAGREESEGYDAREFLESVYHEMLFHLFPPADVSGGESRSAARPGQNP